LRKDLPGDLFAGCTVAFMTFPQTMGYAMLAGLPAIYGKLKI
jgi:MFS superfamily sulfate permease-like transporter